MKMFFPIIFCIVALHVRYLVNCVGVSEEFTWTKLSYVLTQPELSISKRSIRPYKPWNDDIIFPDSFPDYKKLLKKNKNKKYIYENNIPLGANRWKDKLFITVPRRRHGVPSTLNYVPINSPKRHNVPLIPYPDLKTNAIVAPYGEEHLVSVYRVAVDPCDRLWMVDTGILELPGNRTTLGHQRIVIIDLNTGEIIKTYNFKESDLRCGATTLAHVTVDVTANTCDDAYAYFPDYAGFGLVVYSLKKDDSWRINHNYFYLEPMAGEFYIGGAHFQWTDGVFSGGLTEMQNDGYRTYIFHAMAGTHLYSVSTKILRDKKLATRSYHGNDFKVLGDRGAQSQTCGSGLHQQSGLLFLGLVNQNALGCWNTKTTFDPNNFGIVQKNDSAMIYPSDVKIYKDDVIVLTNTMPAFIYSKLDYDKINFRVWMRNVYDAVSGTVCETPRGTRY